MCSSPIQGESNEPALVHNTDLTSHSAPSDVVAPTESSASSSTSLSDLPNLPSFSESSELRSNRLKTKDQLESSIDFSKKQDQSLSFPSDSASLLPEGITSFRVEIFPVVEPVQSLETSTPFESTLPSEGSTPSKKPGLIAWLAITIELTPDWHIYSTTQKSGAGGYPTQFSVDPLSDTRLGNLAVGKFESLSKIHYEEFLGGILEKIEGQATWIAPIYSEITLDSSADSPASNELSSVESLQTSVDSVPSQSNSDAETFWNSVTLSGNIDALVCQAGEGGLCVPFQFPFVAKAAPLDSRKAFDELLKNADSIVTQNETTLKNLRQQISPDVALESAESSKSSASSESQKLTQNDLDSPLSPSGNPNSPDSSVNSENIPSTQTGITLWILISAFLGGLILNGMPCVLPVIGLKIITFFEQAGQSRSRAFFLNAWYAAGILCVFAFLALMSFGLSHLFSFGLFQILMGSIVFAMALSLMGVWELELPAFFGGDRSAHLMKQEGALGAFFKGIITTLLAIPCGAPLLSPVLVWTDTMIQQDHVLLVLTIYLVIGFGMAFPYLLIGAFPELLRFLPKPGLWMDTFKITMGYVLLIAIVWILYSMPLSLILPTITLLFAIWYICWLFGHNQFTATSKKKGRQRFLALLVLILVIMGSFNFRLGRWSNPNPYTLQNAMESKLIHWGIRAERSGLLQQQHWALFEQKEFEKHLSAGHPVLIDFTADWCMNCKLLESTLLHTDAFLDLADRKGLVTLTADYTNKDDDSQEIRDLNALLDRFGGRQVPTLMIFDPGAKDTPTILRGFYTKSTLNDALKKFPDHSSP